MHFDYLASDFGLVKISADDDGILSISFCDAENELVNQNQHTNQAKKQLGQYFSGELRQFDLELNLSGASEFYQKVWHELSLIPFGRTVSYLDIARKIGDEKSVRAVGMANGKNPIAIVLPCHRVIGSNGSLVGYAYGLNVKRRLLALENPREFAINGTLF